MALAGRSERADLPQVFLSFDDSQSLDDITLTQQTLKLDRRPLTTMYHRDLGSGDDWHLILTGSDGNAHVEPYRGKQ